MRKRDQDHERRGSAAGGFATTSSARNSECRHSSRIGRAASNGLRIAVEGRQRLAELQVHALDGVLQRAAEVLSARCRG